MTHRFPCALALLAAIALSTTQVDAQNALTFRAGASLATLGGTDSEGADTRTGVHVGALVTLGLSDLVGIQIGGAYAQKGAAATEDGVSIDLALDYVEIPLLLRVGVPTTGSISPHFVAGPAVAFEASCKVSGSAGGVTASVNCTEGEIPTKSIDFGVIGGAGLAIATAGPVSVTLDVLYTLGMSSIDDAADPEDLKNRAWSVLAGVGIPIG